MTTEERVSRLEGAYEQVDSRLDTMNQSISDLRTDMNQEIATLRSEMNSRFNAQLQVMIGMWVPTMVGIVATLVAVFLRT